MTSREEGLIAPLQTRFRNWVWLAVIATALWAVTFVSCQTEAARACRRWGPMFFAYHDGSEIQILARGEESLPQESWTELGDAGTFYSWEGGSGLNARRVTHASVILPHGLTLDSDQQAAVIEKAAAAVERFVAFSGRVDLFPCAGMLRQGVSWIETPTAEAYLTGGTLSLLGLGTLVGTAGSISCGARIRTTRHRLRDTRCVACGYDLMACAGHAPCPECGLEQSSVSGARTSSLR